MQWVDHEGRPVHRQIAVYAVLVLLSYSLVFRLYPIYLVPGTRFSLRSRART